MARSKPPKARLTKDEKDLLKSKKDKGKEFLVEFSKHPNPAWPDGKRP